MEYTFELHPDYQQIDPSKDLKVWIPVPREWDSQKRVKMISVEWQVTGNIIQEGKIFHLPVELVLETESR